MLLDFLKEARLDRVGCFNTARLKVQTPMPCLTRFRKKERRTLEPFHATAAADFRRAPQEKVGREILVIIDEVDEEGGLVAAWQMHRKSTARFISMVNQR